MLKINTRKSTVYDYVELKGIEPFQWRRNKVGKVVNFSLLFGESAIAFVGQLKTMVFTDETLEAFIKDVKLESQVDSIYAAGKMSLIDSKYLAASTFIREAFFKAYPGLEERLLRELEFGKQNGYVRAWNGPVRHLSEFDFMKFGKNGLIGLDKELYSKLYSRLKNNAGNSPIQTLESDIAQRAFVEEMYYVNKWGLKSRLWNQVHDSGDWFIYVGEGDEDPYNETGLVSALIYHCDTKARYPHFGIPMDIDAAIADVSTEENVANGQIYHHGTDVKFKDYDLQTEIDKWNKLHGTNISYEDLGDGLNWDL